MRKREDNYTFPHSYPYALMTLVRIFFLGRAICFLSSLPDGHNNEKNARLKMPV
jgi:hypothetical protein